MVRSIETVSEPKGIQRDNMVERPALLGIAFEHKRPAAHKSPFDSVQSLLQQNLVRRLLLDHSAGGKHQRDFAIEKETVGRLRDVRPPSRIRHEKEIHSFAAFEPQRFINDAIHCFEIQRTRSGIAQPDVGQRPNQKAARHKIPFGVAGAHSSQFLLPQFWLGPQPYMTCSQFARLW